MPHGGEDSLTVRFPIADRTFVLACLLSKALPDPVKWPDFGRSMATPFLEDGKTVDCASFVFVRRSKEVGFDGYSFLRVGIAPMGTSIPDAELSEAPGDEGSM